MKLHAKIRNNRGGIKNTSDDVRIQVDLYYKNTYLGSVYLYAITGDEVEGYRLFFAKDGSGYGDDIMLLEKEISKGKKKKDECNGKHENVNAIINCEDCSNTLYNM